jgi:hypothetical protein
MQKLATAIQQQCDALFAPLYYPFVCVMLSLLVIFTGVRGQAFTRAWDEWMVADWLISYAPGVVRRGLSGELILRASSVAGVPANDLVLAVVVVLFATLCILFTRLLRGKRITFWYFWLCVSPGFLLFTFYDPFALGRKELVLFVVFAAWAVALARRTPGLPSLVAFSLAAFAATLMHEIFLFFSPYFVALSVLVATRRGDDSWKRSLLIPGSSLLALLLMAQFPARISDPSICARLLALGAPASVCMGVLSYDATTTGEAVGRFTSSFTSATLLGLAGVVPLVLVPLYLFLIANVQQARRVTLIVGALIVASLPLFVVGVDWGRWISIHLVMSTIMCAMFLPEKAERERVAPQERRWAPVALGLCAVASMFLWSLNHCCQQEYMRLFGPIDRLRPW